MGAASRFRVSFLGLYSTSSSDCYRALPPDPSSFFVFSSPLEKKNLEERGVKSRFVFSNVFLRLVLY